jgi:hypothetical protein
VKNFADFLRQATWPQWVAEGEKMQFPAFFWPNVSGKIADNLLAPSFDEDVDSLFQKLTPAQPIRAASRNTKYRPR